VGDGIASKMYKSCKKRTLFAKPVRIPRATAAIVQIDISWPIISVALFVIGSDDSAGI
jgi:hypothetical protein